MVSWIPLLMKAGTYETSLMEIILIRHAKSSWKNTSLEDHQRPLNKRGLKDAPKMASWLQKRLIKNKLDYDLVSSDSTRTQLTAQYFIKALEVQEPRYTRELYHASADKMEELIARFMDDQKILIIVAHNPGLTEALNRISALRLDNLPTCGIASLNYSGRSDLFTFNKCSFNWLQYPKAL